MCTFPLCGLNQLKRKRRKLIKKRWDLGGGIKETDSKPNITSDSTGPIIAVVVEDILNAISVEISQLGPRDLEGFIRGKGVHGIGEGRVVAGNKTGGPIVKCIPSEGVGGVAIRRRGRFLGTLLDRRDKSFVLTARRVIGFVFNVVAVHIIQSRAGGCTTSSG